MKYTSDICGNKHQGNDESVKAGKRSRLGTDQQRTKVLEAIRSSIGGITMKELAEAWGVQLNTISGRATELKKLGLIEKAGTVRDGSAVLRMI